MEMYSTNMILFNHDMAGIPTFLSTFSPGVDDFDDDHQSTWIFWP
jgi:hypothetical protein